MHQGFWPSRSQEYPTLAKPTTTRTRHDNQTGHHDLHGTSAILEEAMDQAVGLS